MYYLGSSKLIMLIRYVLVVLSCFILLCQVQAQNLPVADAGVDQVVPTGDTVTLDGSGSSVGDGGTLMYSWSQTGGGVDVTLDESNPSMPTFIAPYLTADDSPLVLTFELIVNDGFEDSVANEVEIIVIPPLVINYSFVLNFSEVNLLSGLTHTEVIGSTNIVHLQNEGYNQSSMIFTGGFNTSSTSSQLIYESGGATYGTTLRIDEIEGQLSFVVSTGSDNDVDISSNININRNYVYLVEITGAADGSAIILYITEDNSLSALDSVTPISSVITSTGNNLAGSDASSYRSATSNYVQGDGVSPLGTVGDFEGFATSILFFSDQSIDNARPVANAGANQIVFSGVQK